jgi:hypothetical protein
MNTIMDIAAGPIPTTTAGRRVRRKIMLLKLNASKIALYAMLLCCSSGVYAETALSLTSPEQAQIWRSLGKEATRSLEPAGLYVGEMIPDTMHLLPFARKLRKRVPAIRSYSYTLLHGQVLIIDPQTKRIVSIISK